MAEFKEDVHITADPVEDTSGLPERHTSRLRVDSWERSNRLNQRAGDAIALHWMVPEAKAFIGWWDATDPANPVCKAWIGAHDEANNPDAEPHQHFSIEVPDSSGQMQTRLGIPYDKDHTNITTTSADFTVMEGTLRIPRGSRLEFSEDKSGANEPKWQFRMAPNGSLRIVHYKAGNAEPELVARLNPMNGQVEVSSLAVGNLLMTDRGTGEPVRLYVENGQVCVEEV